MKFTIYKTTTIKFKSLCHCIKKKKKCKKFSKVSTTCTGQLFHVIHNVSNLTRRYDISFELTTRGISFVFVYFRYCVCVQVTTVIHLYSIGQLKLYYRMFDLYFYTISKNKLEPKYACHLNVFTKALLKPFFNKNVFLCIFTCVLIYWMSYRSELNTRIIVI